MVVRAILLSEVKKFVFITYFLSENKTNHSDDLHVNLDLFEKLCFTSDIFFQLSYNV